MKITKEKLKEIIKEELGGVLEEAKKTPEWSSDYYRGVGHTRAGRGKSAHGSREDPFSSPIRYVKSKLGVPRDKIEKFRRDYNLTTGGEIGDRALSYALYSSRRTNIFKKTMKAIKKDEYRTIDALKRLSSVVDSPANDPDAREPDWRDTIDARAARYDGAKREYFATVNKIISGERG
tara:strand:- start:1524 stop:2057 length:534 start_codon:yes stop_codon:yes gene_type:complete